MNKLAFANNLYVEQSKDGFYVFEDNSPSTTSSSSGSQRPSRSRNSNFFFNVLNLENQLLEVDFVNTPIADIINDIGTALNIDVFTATPLDQAGLATFKAKSVSFDALLSTIFEGQSNQNLNASNPNSANNSNFNNQNQQSSSNGNKIKGSKRFSYKKEGALYFFGTENQLSVREVAIIQLQHRSVELLSDPSGGGGSRNSRSQVQNVNPNSRNNTNINSNQIDNFSNQNRNQLNTNSNQSFNNYSSKAEALVNILPDEIIEALDIKVDYELNSFYVNGPSSNVKRFREFISKIDKPVPVILIEVMLIEVTSNATVETGVSWGIGDEPTETTGSVFPNADLTVGARTINKVIGGFDGFGSLNLGKVVPNFFATIKALESNGKLKVRSTPKLSTLNGHRAHFSNGQTSYYTVTQRNIYGTDNPQTSEITNYQPIEAELGLTIKPIVSGNGQVTLDIFVVQSNFRGRISEDAPPDISSREFSSIIRVKDQDIVVLGGLEEQFTDNSGTGVPFLSRIPIIKWLFSSRKREAKKARLTVLIKPTIIY
jgi:type IV pilus assembly protein PilQ